MTNVLPPEILVNILCRLTVKDLLRCRSVSRSWCFLIDGPDFIKHHLNHSISTSRNLGLVLNARDRDLYWLDLDTLLSPVRLSQLPIVNDDDGDGIEILGCCHGVLALGNSYGFMALWNPSTRKYRNLSYSDVIEFPSRGVVDFGATGFGYDSVNDDYKLVRVVLFIDMDLDCFPTEVKVYSVKANAWKTVSDFPCYYGYQRVKGVLVNGALHWLVSKKPECDSLFLIVAFDLVNEQCREVPVPSYDDRYFYVKIGELGGCLSMVKNYNPDNSSVRVEIWVMKEYGIRESWTMLFSLMPSHMSGSFSYAENVAYFESCDRVLLDLGGETFVLYDLKTKTVENLRIFGVPKFFEARLCVGSLVGFHGGDADNKTTRKQEEDGKNRKRQKHQKGGKKR